VTERMARKLALFCKFRDRSEGTGLALAFQINYKISLKQPAGSEQESEQLPNIVHSLSGYSQLGDVTTILKF